MRTVLIVFPISMILFLTGCQTTNPEVNPAVAPEAESWSTSTKDGKVPTPKAWLDDLQTPALTQLIDDALANNFNLHASAARIRAAEAVIDSRNAARLPIASFGADLSRSDRQFGDASNTISAGPQVRWEIDLWDRLKNERDAAAADAQALAWQDAALRFSLAINIARTWCSAATNQQLIDLAKQTIKSYEKTLEAVNDQYKAGIVTAVDVHLAEASLAGSKATLHSASSDLAADLRAIDVLVGRHPSGTEQISATIPPVPLVPAGIPSTLLMRRPDLQVAAHQLNATELRREVAEKLHLPSLALTGAAGTSSRHLNDLLRTENLLWSLAAGLTQPIFEGGRIEADKTRAAAAQEEAAARWAQAILEAFGEVETALATEGFVTDQITALDAAAKASTAAEEQSQRRYEEGLSNLTEVLVAQRRALEAKRSLIRAHNAKVQNRLSLYLALGGSFQ